jgi:hypothetical protein
MHDEVDLAPGLLDIVENRVDRCFIADITVSGKNAAEFGRQRLDPLLQRIALISKGNLAALCMNSFGNAPRNRTIVGNAHNDAALA